MAPSVPLQGAVGVLPLLGAIVGCHCSVVWLGERVKTNFGGVGVPLLSAIAIVLSYGGGEEGVDVVPLQGAILECYGRVTTMYYGGGKEGRPLLGEWIWCHCWVPFRCAIVMDVVPLLGVIAIAICHCNVLWWGARVTTIFGRVDVVRLLGAIAAYQSLFQMFLLFSGPPISPSHPRKRQ